MPRGDEQGRVDTWLNAAVDSLPSQNAEAEIGIAPLQERRGALIASAVTGQNDEREKA